MLLALQIVINNAAVNPGLKPFEEIQEKDLQEVYQVRRMVLRGLVLDLICACDKQPSSGPTYGCMLLAGRLRDT